MEGRSEVEWERIQTVVLAIVLVFVVLLVFLVVLVVGGHGSCRSEHTS